MIAFGTSRRSSSSRDSFVHILRAASLAFFALALVAVSSACGQGVDGLIQQPSIAASVAALQSNASQNQSSGQAADSQQSPKDKSRLAVNPVTGEVTSSGAAFTPLKGNERWKLYWTQNYFSVGAYFGPVITSLVLDQATGSPSQWGGGFGGYGLRLASRTAGAIIQGTVQAPVAALLHEDVRYISGSKPGFKRRLVHSIVYSFLTYNDKGRPTLNIANLGGYYASAAISTTWLPGSNSVGKYTLTNGSEQIALNVPVNMLQEFWPDIVQKFHRH